MVPQRASRDRMLAALNCQAPDFPPCSFMLFGTLHQKALSYLAFVEQQLTMGLDACVMLPPRPPMVVNDHYNLHGLPVSYAPDVTIEAHFVHQPGEALPLLVKTYHTPAGDLTTQVQKTADWRWGDHVPFLDDYLIPRATQFILQNPHDLDAFEYLLQPPTDVEIQAFQQDSAPVLEFARKHNLLTCGGWGVGADMIGWVFGLDNLVYAVFDQPDFVRDMLALIGDWNRQRMAVVLESSVDLYIKRAWYENTDFFNPAAWEALILPELKQDAHLAHQAGAKLGYIITASAMPLLDKIASSGVDVLIGVDPHAYDLVATKAALQGKVCVWGGVNGHLTVENGSPEAVRAEVATALDTLGPGGLILSPVDNIREDTPGALHNVTVLIEAWQAHTGQR